VAQTRERLAKHFRAEAARLRKRAERAKHETIRRQLVSIAFDYDGLARTVEMIDRGHQGKGFTST
jgi:hypothetical protein